MGKRVPIKKSDRLRIFARDGQACRYCGARACEGAVLHIDHIRPVKLGGTNEDDNLVTACRECNLGKSASDMFVSKKEHVAAIEKLKKEYESALLERDCQEKASASDWRHGRQLPCDEDEDDWFDAGDYDSDESIMWSVERLLVEDFEDYGCEYCGAVQNLRAVGELYLCAGVCVGSLDQIRLAPMEVPF